MYYKEGWNVLENKDNDKVRQIAFKLRRIREVKGLTREKFCERLGENSDYWGLIERGEQPISLSKLLQVCEVYDIPIESVVELKYVPQNDSFLRKDIEDLLDQCQGRQLEIIRKFIADIVMIL